MASGQEKNFNDDPYCSPSEAGGSNNNSNDSVPKPVEKESDNLNINKDSQSPFHQNHGNQPVVSPNLHFSTHQSFSREINLIRLRTEQPCRMSNVPSSSHPLHHHSSENASNMVQEPKIISDTRHKIDFDCNKNAALHGPSGTEVSERQNSQSSRQCFGVQQPSKNLGSHSPIIESTDHMPRNKRHSSSKRHNRTEDRGNTITDKHIQIDQGINEISPFQGSYSQQFSEFQRCDSQIQQKYVNKSIVSRSLNILSHQPHQTMSNVGLKTSSERLGKESSSGHDANYFADNSKGTKRSISRKQNTSADQEPERDSVDMSMLQYPYSNRSENINIFVYGQSDWTNRFLQTYAGGTPLRFGRPFCLAFERNITRCGIIMTVSMWKIESFEASINLLKSSLSVKSTIVLLLNVLHKPKLLSTLRPVIEAIQRFVDQSVPVILVGYKDDSSSSDTVPRRVRKNSFALKNMGFRLKARYDLSAFMLCSVDSTTDVEAVIFTALDVSHLRRGNDFQQRSVNIENIHCSL